ncbi:copper resistance D family protein [Pseudonocardia sp. GCM10023141]|uniref:copper resistance D family protein n=1 Tax=Pseudonocardia sp. GCM10023141 TaxID=3252653 RepID=UPI0036064B9F
MSRPAASTGWRDLRVPAAWSVLAAGAAVVAASLAGSLTGGAPAILLGAIVARAGMDAAAVACVGLGLLGVLLPPDGTLRGGAGRELPVVQSRADRALVAVSGAWLALVVLDLGLRAAAAYGRPLTSLSGNEIVLFATAVEAGRGLLLTAGCTAVVLGCAIVRVRNPHRMQVRIPLVAALLGTLTPALTGHSGTDPDHQLAVVTVALHAGAAAVWVGGLGAMLVLIAGRRALLDAALPRFSRLATVCLVAVAVTGVLNAALRLSSWAALFGSGYGVLVLAKVVCLGLAAGLGGLARQRLAARRTPVLRWAVYEVAVMAVAIGLAAALTQTAFS